MKNGQVSPVIYTPPGQGARTDQGKKIRAAAVAAGVTGMTKARAADPRGATAVAKGVPGPRRGS
jgi:hypothetical protein